MAKTQAKEVFAPAQLSKMLERDFSETSREDHALSFLDKKFLNVLESSIQHRDDGHYEMPLPLKEEGLKLPNNRTLALSRLERLKQRLKRDRKYRDHYEAFMKEMIDKGQAERVHDREREAERVPVFGTYLIMVFITPINQTRSTLSLTPVQSSRESRLTDTFYRVLI